MPYSINSIERSFSQNRLSFVTHDNTINPKGIRFHSTITTLFLKAFAWMIGKKVIDIDVWVEGKKEHVHINKGSFENWLKNNHVSWNSSSTPNYDILLGKAIASIRKSTPTIQEEAWTKWCTSQGATEEEAKTLAYEIKKKNLSFAIGENLPIHEAAKLGNVEIVNAMLDRNPDLLHAKGEKGRSILHFAAQEGHQLLVQALYDPILSMEGNADDADILMEDDKGYLPIHCAIINGHGNIVLYLDFRHKYNADKEECFPIHHAASRGRLEIVQHLLTDELLNLKTKDGSQLIHMAAQSGNVGLMKYLIGKGAKITEKDNDGWLPIHHAASFGQLDMVKFLNELRKKQIKKEGKKHNPLCEKSNDGSQVMHFAARGENTALIDYIIQSTKKNIEEKDNDGWLPIHHAAFSGSLEMVKHLHDKNNDSLFAANAEGEQPIHLAARGNNTALMDFFIHNGADINAKDNEGWTPLKCAETEKEQDWEMIQYIRSKMQSA